MVSEHDQRVQVLLTADEYLFARDYAREQGLSVSAYLRQLLNNDRRSLAQKQLSASDPGGNTSELTQDMRTILKALAKLAKDYE